MAEVNTHHGRGEHTIWSGLTYIMVEADIQLILQDIVMVEVNHQHILPELAMVRVNHVDGRAVQAPYPAGYVWCSTRPGIWQCLTIIGFSVVIILSGKVVIWLRVVSKVFTMNH